MVVAVASFLVSAVVTHWAESVARHLTAVRGWQVALITLAYLLVSALFFVVKFVIYETVVFTKAPDVVAAVDPDQDGSLTQRAQPAMGTGDALSA
jgi:hypothetical protein